MVADVLVRLAVDAGDRAACRAIRRSVFVDEQRVPESVEVDGLDDVCAHFVAFAAGRPVATARARETARGYKLERVAVVAELRGRRVGEALVKHLLRAAPAGLRVYVHAQHGALAFWQRLGFRAVGAPFEEGGIRHSLMERGEPSDAR